MCRLKVDRSKKVSPAARQGSHLVLRRGQVATAQKQLERRLRPSMMALRAARERARALTPAGPPAMAASCRPLLALGAGPKPVYRARDLRLSGAHCRPDLGRSFQPTGCRLAGPASAALVMLPALLLHRSPVRPGAPRHRTRVCSLLCSSRLLRYFAGADLAARLVAL